MCHGYMFSPLLKLLSCLARGGTDINVGVIQITQTDTYRGYGFWIKFLRPQIEMVSKPFETTGKYRSKQKK